MLGDVFFSADSISTSWISVCIVPTVLNCITRTEMILPQILLAQMKQKYMKTSVWSGFTPFVIYNIKFRFDELHSDQTHTYKSLILSLSWPLRRCISFLHVLIFPPAHKIVCKFTFCISTETIASDQPEFVLFLAICLCDVWHESICGGEQVSFFSCTLSLLWKFSRISFLYENWWYQQRLNGRTREHLLTLSDID